MSNISDWRRPRRFQEQRASNQATSELRTRLSRFIVDGDRFVQSRCTAGHRIAVRKADRK